MEATIHCMNQTTTACCAVIFTKYFDANLSTIQRWQKELITPAYINRVSNEELMTTSLRIENEYLQNIAIRHAAARNAIHHPHNDAQVIRSRSQSSENEEYDHRQDPDYYPQTYAAKVNAQLSERISSFYSLHNEKSDHVLDSGSNRHINYERSNFDDYIKLSKPILRGGLNIYVVRVRVRVRVRRDCQSRNI